MEMQEAAEALLERNAELEEQKRGLVRTTPAASLGDIHLCIECVWR